MWTAAAGLLTEYGSIRSHHFHITLHAGHIITLLPVPAFISSATQHNRTNQPTAYAADGYEVVHTGPDKQYKSTGLYPGKSYRFKVYATNVSGGGGPASGALTVVLTPALFGPFLTNCPPCPICHLHACMIYCFKVRTLNS